MNASVRLSASLGTIEDPRWVAVTRRDAAADGRFFYSVRTTGVYCLPSCASRRAKPEHVAFHATAAEAQAAGFRPCKRCKPDQPPAAARNAELVAECCRMLSDAERTPTLHQLASHAGMSPYHLHRIFKGMTGLTPRDFAAGQRAARLKDALISGQTVTAAVYAAGFSSSSRFYEKSRNVLGMAPSRYRDGGKGDRIRFATGKCSLGAILVAESPSGLCAVLMGNDTAALKRDLERRFRNAILVAGDSDFNRTLEQVIGFVEAPRTDLALPLDLRGTLFQQKVWRALQAIPPGKTASYKDIASAIGSPSAVRAVASACAANALAVAIPCHRVVRTGGGLSGYRWGVERKQALLDREAEE